MSNGLRRRAYRLGSITAPRFALQVGARLTVASPIGCALLVGCALAWLASSCGGTVDAFRAQQADCQRGSATACRAVGWSYENGEGVSADHDAACEHLVLACDGDDGRSCYDLAGLCYVGSGPRGGDDTQGPRLVQRACDLGYELACTQANILKTQDQPL